jgi:hypothetical protein
MAVDAPISDLAPVGDRRRRVAHERPQMTELVLYEAARAALTAAVNVDEVKNVRNLGVAMQILAKQAKDSDLIDKATELRLRAERRLGEMIIAQKETIGLNQGASRVAPLYQSRRRTSPTLTAPERWSD